MISVGIVYRERNDFLVSQTVVTVCAKERCRNVSSLCSPLSAYSIKWNAQVILDCCVSESVRNHTATSGTLEELFSAHAIDTKNSEIRISHGSLERIGVSRYRRSRRNGGCHLRNGPGDER